MNAEWALLEEKLNSQHAGSLIGAIIFSAIICSVGFNILFGMLFAFPIGTIAAGAIGVGLYKAIKSLFDSGSRITRCKKYLGIIRNSNGTVEIDALCQYTGNARAKVHADLQWLRTSSCGKCLPFKINFKTGKITVNEYKFNADAAYTTYEFNEIDNTIHAENAPKGNIPARPKKSPTVIKDEAETIFVFREGDMQFEANRFLQHLAAQKERCQDEEISQLIVNLRVGIGKLLSYGYQNPHDCEQIRSFNRKYLITCIKLLDKFIEMEQLVKDSPVHRETREQLVTGLENLVSAYNLNLQNMYNDDVVDINSDITVIESMLAQEGLLTDGDLVMDMSKLNEKQ